MGIHDTQHQTEEARDHFEDLGLYQDYQKIADRFCSLDADIAIPPADVYDVVEIVKRPGLPFIFDTESRHAVFDAVLCAIAIRAGFGDFADTFLNMDKWYS